MKKFEIPTIYTIKGYSESVFMQSGATVQINAITVSGGNNGMMRYDFVFPSNSQGTYNFVITSNNSGVFQEKNKAPNLFSNSTADLEIINVASSGDTLTFTAIIKTSNSSTARLEFHGTATLGNSATGEKVG